MSFGKNEKLVANWLQSYMRIKNLCFAQIRGVLEMHKIGGLVLHVEIARFHTGWGCDQSL